MVFNGASTAKSWRNYDTWHNRLPEGEKHSYSNLMISYDLVVDLSIMLTPRSIPLDSARHLTQFLVEAVLRDVLDVTAI